MGSGPTDISVQLECLSECPDFGLGYSGPLPQAFPLYSITSVLGILPLDATVMGDSDSILVCQTVSKISALPLVYTLLGNV